MIAHHAPWNAFRISLDISVSSADPNIIQIKRRQEFITRSPIIERISVRVFRFFEILELLHWYTRQRKKSILDFQFFSFSIETCPFFSPPLFDNRKKGIVGSFLLAQEFRLGRVILIFKGWIKKKETDCNLVRKMHSLVWTVVRTYNTYLYLGGGPRTVCRRNS